MGIKPSDALIIGDIQNDFCPGGTLAVPQGDEIVKPINAIMPLFSFIVAVQDWHPKDHCSFKSQGGLWPPHCVQNTWGAELHPLLSKEKINLYIHKGQYQDRDAYSAFQETHLKEELKKRKIKRVFVTGLATDYCVRQTALDAILNGFETVVLVDLIHAINARPDDGRKALEEVEKAGARLLSSKDLKS